MRLTIIVLLIALCAGTALAQSQPEDRVPFEHWAYDAFTLLNDVLDGTMTGLYWEDPFHAEPPLTRYQCAIGVLQTLNLLLESDITAETPDVEGYGWAWHELATEFLPEVILAGEPAAYMAPAEPTPPWPSPRPEEALPVNLAIRDLRSVPHDHWLYPEAQRVLWMAAEMDYTDASSEAASPADTVTWKHWGYQALQRLAPVAFPDRDTSFLDDRAMVRYEFAMFAFRTLRELLEIEQPTTEHEDLAVTWALLALEFWPEYVELQEDLAASTQHEWPGMRWVDGGTTTVASDIYSVPEDHWLYPIVTRVLELAERND